MRQAFGLEYLNTHTQKSVFSSISAAHIGPHHGHLFDRKASMQPSDFSSYTVMGMIPSPAMFPKTTRNLNVMLKSNVIIQSGFCLTNNSGMMGEDHDEYLGIK